jgi:D-lactate dehydrogenase (cytochrome)
VAGKAALLLGASVGSGILGYVLAQNQVYEGRNTTPHPVPDSPAFGSPLEFQKAISELKAAFADASAVSTDPDDLRIHGFSENDYYPGASIQNFPFN